MIGFVDAKQDTLKVAEPKSEECYRLLFNDDNTVWGKSSTNNFSCIYEIDLQSSIKLSYFLMTEINELYDGRLYIECLKNVNTFSMTEKGLVLYYESNKFLLFKPIEHED